MPKAQLPTPDSIAGARGTPSSDLQAKVSAFSNYQGDSVQSVGGMAPTNMLSQLGAALTHLNPALAQAGIAITKEHRAQDSEAGAAKAGELRQEYAEAVKAGKIPAGNSQAYIDAYKATELDNQRMRYEVDLQKFYDENNFRNEDNTDLVANKLNEFSTKWRNGVLQSEDGQPKYSVRDIANAKFDDKLNGAAHSVLARHNQWRITEREREGKEAAMTNAGLVIDKFHKTEPLRMADEIVNAFYDPITGVAKNGLTHTEANHLMTDVIATKAVEMGDETILDVAKHIFTNSKSGARLAGRTDTIAKFKQASDAIMASTIRNTNWNWTQRERAADEAAGVTPEMKSAKTAQAWQEHDAAQVRQLQDWRNKDTFDHIKAQSALSSSTILKGLDLKDMNNPSVKKSFDWLRDNDYQTWMTMTTYVNSYKKEKSAFHDTTASEMRAAQLRFDMSRDPLHFNPANVMAAANEGTINPNKVQPLLDDWDKAKTHVDNPFLQNEGFKDLISGVRRAAAKDMNDQYGPGAVLAMKAEKQLRENAYDWISRNQGNPKASYRDFIKEMADQAENVTLDFSPHFAKKEARKEEARQNPKPEPAPDTRSTYEKYVPNFVGGKSAPEPVKPEPKGPPPLTRGQALGAMKPEVSASFMSALRDPNVDDVELEAMIHNSGLWSFMKANGRSAAEFKAIKDELMGSRKRK